MLTKIFFKSKLLTKKDRWLKLEQNLYKKKKTTKKKTTTITTNKQKIEEKSVNL